MRLCKSSCVNLICLPITSIRGHSMPVSNMRWVFSHPLTHISLSLMNRGFQGWEMRVRDGQKGENSSLILGKKRILCILSYTSCHTWALLLSVAYVAVAQWLLSRRLFHSFKQSVSTAWNTLFDVVKHFVWQDKTLCYAGWNTSCRRKRACTRMWKSVHTGIPKIYIISRKWEQCSHLSPHPSSLSLTTETLYSSASWWCRWEGESKICFLVIIVVVFCTFCFEIKMEEFF